jgi:hypothetical protein
MSINKSKTIKEYDHRLDGVSEDQRLDGVCMRTKDWMGWKDKSTFGLFQKVTVVLYKTSLMRWSCQEQAPSSNIKE